MGKFKRKKHKYTKQEFINICCKKCGLCEEGTSPDLCYSELYVSQPKKFIKVIFRNLLSVKDSFDKAGLCASNIGNTYLEHVFFRKAFCSANLCGNYNSYKQCDYIVGCMAAFRKQTKVYDNIYTSVPQKHSQKKKKSSKKNRYVAKAYPTFFTNGNADFLEEIKEILKDNENNNK